MNVERIKEIVERQPNLSTALGMNFISTPDDDLCMATMKVDERNRQPFGFLSGGAFSHVSAAQLPVRAAVCPSGGPGKHRRKVEAACPLFPHEQRHQPVQ